MFEQPTTTKSTGRKIFEKAVVAASLVAVMGGELPKEAFAGDSNNDVQKENVLKDNGKEDFFNLNKPKSSTSSEKSAYDFSVRPNAIPRKSNPKATKEASVGNENANDSVENDLQNLSSKDANGNTQTRSMGYME